MESVKTAPRTKKFISKRRLIYFFKFAIAAAVMIMLLRRMKLNNLNEALLSANIYCITLAALLLIPNLYIQFFKWRYLVRLVKPDVSNQEIGNSLLAGFTFGFITPGRLGEFGRAFFIKDCPWVKIFGMTFMDKFFSLAVVIFWGAIGVMFFIGGELGPELYIYTLAPMIIFCLITLIVIYYIVLRPEIIRGFLYSMNVILPFRDKIKLLMSSLDNFHRRQALNLLLLSVCFYFIFFLQFYILVCAFEQAPIVAAFLAIASVMLVKSMLPISVGDLGIRESAAIFFLGKIGLLEATAFNASILLFVINLLVPSIIGLFLVLKYRLVFQKNGR